VCWSIISTLMKERLIRNQHTVRMSLTIPSKPDVLWCKGIHWAVLVTNQWGSTFVCKQHSARCLNPQYVNTISHSYHRLMKHITVTHTCCIHIPDTTDGTGASIYSTAEITCWSSNLNSTLASWKWCHLISKHTCNCSVILLMKLCLLEFCA
jgi:hypothetical protein